MKSSFIFTAVLTAIFSTGHSYQYNPFQEELDGNYLLLVSKPTDRKDGSFPQSQTSSDQLNPIINFVASFGDKKVYSVFMPIDKEVKDLMTSESNVSPSLVDINRRAGPKMPNSAKKQLNTQLSNGFANFGDVFGQSFGDEFAKSFSNLSKQSKTYSNRGQSFGGLPVQSFVRRRANFPKRLKNMIRFF